MKITLISPPMSMEERYSKDVKDVGGHLAPLGLAYLGSVLEKSGHRVNIIDSPAMSYDIFSTMIVIGTFKPEFIGITAMTPSMNTVIELCKKIKSVHSSTIICIGGPHATIMPKDTLKRTKADMILVGEGEITMVDICNNPKKYLNKVIHGKQVKDLDSIPFPARHLMNMNKYKSLPNNYKKSPYVVNMVTSRGCPFRCTFCCKDKNAYNFRSRSVENVIEEIKHVIKEYGTKEIAFWDDLFTMRREWIMEFCNRIIEENIDIAWSCETRVNFVDISMLRKMKDSGCWNIFYGLEAGDQQLLNNINKGITIEQIRKAISLTKIAGIEIRGSFMIALPGETPELARKTIDFAIELEPDYAQFTITTPFPGTVLYKEAHKWGTLSKNYDDYNEWSPVFIPFGYKDSGEIKSIHKEAFKRFYFRPRYMIRRLLKIRTFGDIKRNLLGLKVVRGFK